MKIKFSTNLAVNIVIVGIVLFFTFQLNHILMPSFVGRMLPYTQFYTHADDLPPIDTPIPMDILHSRYIVMRDSIKQTRDLIDGNMPNASGGQFAYIVGTGGYYKLCDTCTLKSYWKDITKFKREERTQYYIKLPAWGLKIAKLEFFVNDSVKYYVDHHQAYIRKMVIDSVIKTQTPENIYKTHLVNEPVNFSYIRRDQCIAIPVVSSAKNIMDVVVVVASILLIVYFLVLIGVFVKFIIDLSKGLAFTDQNVARLRLIAFSLIFYTLFNIVIIYLEKLLFHNYFTDDIVLSSDVWGLWKIIGIGIVFLLFYRAFRQGKLLKDEQELTV